MKTLSASVLVAVLGTTLPAMANAQDDPVASDEPITREEYDALKRELEELRTLLRTMATVPEQPADPPPEPRDVPAESAEWQDAAQQDEEESLRKDILRTNLRIDDLEQQTLTLDSGDSGFHVSGFGFTRLVAREGGSTTLSTAVVPVFLWRINDRIFFESEVEFEVGTGDGETEVVLEYANASYLLNDYVTLGIGKFLTPFGLFSERLHPAWINKLPDGPLVYGHDGLTPLSSVGAYVRGGVPAGSMKLNYSFYVTTGPSLGDEGGLHFESINESLAGGGRVGLQPIPALEIGYSFLVGRSKPEGGGDDADTLIQGFDVSYVRQVEQLSGFVDLRFEYVNSDVDSADFEFENKRQGFYAQAAYRPAMSEIELLKNLEFVGRYDYLDQPSGAPGAHDEERWTTGINYWLSPSTVLKFAYQWTDIKGEGQERAFLFMFAVGF